jgi:hypothetical protein
MLRLQFINRRRRKRLLYAVQEGEVSARCARECLPIIRAGGANEAAAGKGT